MYLYRISGFPSLLISRVLVVFLIRTGNLLGEHNVMFIMCDKDQIYSVSTRWEKMSEIIEPNR